MTSIWHDPIQEALESGMTMIDSGLSVEVDMVVTPAVPPVEEPPVEETPEEGE